MKLMVAVPYMEGIPGETMTCLEALIGRLRRIGVEHELRMYGQTLVYMARTRLAADAINGAFSHILWLDSDMIFEPDLYERLAAHNLPFVTGVYLSRHKGFRQVVYDRVAPIHALDVSGGGVVEIQACGFGCVLMETRIVADVLEKKGTDFTPMPNFGEDIAFCVRAHDCGWRLYCDRDVEVGHIARIPIWPRDRDTLAALRG